MRVVVPYARGLLHPRVVPAIVMQGYDPEMYECVNAVGDPRSYPALLREWFYSGTDFCVIEHDNESRAGFLDDLRDCPEPWCFFAYDLYRPFEEVVNQPTDVSAPLGVDFSALGHTRFRAGLGEEIRELLDAPFFSLTWAARDTFISGALHAIGYVAHRHPGKAFHHHPYQAHERLHEPPRVRVTDLAYNT